MRRTWRDRGACVGLDPAIFFPTLDDENSDNQGLEAKNICAGCDVRADCLDYAIRANEQHGIWGGVGLDRRRGVRKVLRSGAALAYQQALAAEMDELLRSIRGTADTRPYVAEHDCARCGEPVPAGQYPPDRNGPAARCGFAATYNRGCRCRPCADAKATYIRERRSSQASGKMDGNDNTPEEHA